MTLFTMTLESPIGTLKLSSDERSLKSISFDAVYVLCDSFITEVLLEAKRQLEAYFSGNLVQFDLPLDPEGTEFQRLVWKQIAEVKYGMTKSYVDIAREMKAENSSRAVGMANGRNPLPIIIPCHRIIGNNGKLTGYAGGLERKRWLLLHEQKFSGNDRLF